MGLDSYVSRLPARPKRPYDFPATPSKDHEVFYWRKAYVIHGWMMRLRAWKSGYASNSWTDDSVVALTSQDIDSLERHIESRNLYVEFDPDGVLWDELVPVDLQFVAKARDELIQGHHIYYWASL